MPNVLVSWYELSNSLADKVFRPKPPILAYSALLALQVGSWFLCDQGAF